MATVKLNAAAINDIVGQVRASYEQDRLKFMDKEFEIGPDVGDEVYSWLVPVDKEKQLRELMPPWMVRQNTSMCIRVEQTEGTGLIKTCSPYSTVLRLPFKDKHLIGTGHTFEVDLPGVESSWWDGTTLTLWMKDEKHELPESTASKLVDELYAQLAKHDKVTKTSEEAQKTMRAYLGQFSSVQKAIKKDGPWLTAYLPQWMKDEMNRVPPKRVRIPKSAKTEPVEININKLVARATANKLNI